MSTAIIGLGNIGTTLANNLVAGGEQVLIADNTFSKAQELATKLGSQAQAVTVDDAVNQAQVIILSIWFDGIKDFFINYREQLAGKIIVDPSNPLGPADGGGFKKIIPEDQSSGEILAGLLPPQAILVKAFGTLGAKSLASAANRSPEKAVEFYATDDIKAGLIVEKLIKANGFEPLYIGGINQSIRIEVYGELHEFGKLGRLVTLEEAKDLI
ncbi:NADPH-dependent F420 reductase [Acinetobacter sp. GN11]